MKNMRRTPLFARRVVGLLAVTALAVGPWPGAQTPCRGEARAKYTSDLAAFFAKVDEIYPFFGLKGTGKDWAATKQRLSAKVKTCKSDTEFLGIVLDAVRCLRDAHMYVRDTKANLPERPKRYYPGISFLPAAGNTVIVMHPPKGREKTLRTGTIVTAIDGKSARRFLEDRAEKAWADGGFFSSPQRARVFEYRVPLLGKMGERHLLACLIGGRRRNVILTCAVEPRGWPRMYNMPKDLKRVGRSFWYTKLPGGAGYMYFRRVDDSSRPGLAEALAKIPDAKGWVVDLRGNSGGGYDASLIDAIKKIPRPVAAIIDAGCISAGETLARDLVRYAGARLFGTKTAGSSSSKKQWRFPSGIATVQIPVRSRWGIDRKPIEFNGIDPHEKVEPVAAEVSRGLNSATRRAEEYLGKKQRLKIAD